MVHLQSSGRRTYKKLNKPHLPNHRVYDPRKENEKQDYFYSLLLLFHPFRNECDLLEKDQTAEDAFYQFITSDANVQNTMRSSVKFCKLKLKFLKLMSIMKPQNNIPRKT